MSQKTKTIIKEIEEVGQPDQSEMVKVAVLNNDIKHLSEAMTRIEGKFDTAIQGFVTHEKLSDSNRAFEAKNAEQDKAIKKLEDWNTWAVRIVLGMVITAVLGLVLITKTGGV